MKEEKKEVERMLHPLGMKERIVAEEEEQLIPGGGNRTACAGDDDEEVRLLLREKEEKEILEQSEQINLFCVCVTHTFHHSVINALDEEIAELISP